jgi:hypothetical protein
VSVQTVQKTAMGIGVGKSLEHMFFANAAQTFHTSHNQQFNSATEQM